MLAYLGLEKARQSNRIQLRTGDENADGNDEAIPLPDDLQLPEMSCQLVERLINVFQHPHKCHRNIYDQDRKFLDAVVGWMKGASGQTV